MTYPNTLIFVDFPSTDPAASAEFYAAVFGWEVEPRPDESFHRIVPGQSFMLDDGTPGTDGQPAHGDLPRGECAAASRSGGRGSTGRVPVGADAPRVWILVSDDDSIDRILSEAESRGAQILWRDHFWAEFNGFNAAFVDPWGNTLRALGEGRRQSGDRRGDDQ